MAILIVLSSLNTILIKKIIYKNLILNKTIDKQHFFKLKTNLNSIFIISKVPYLIIL